MSQNRLLALLLALFVAAAWWPLKANAQPVPQSVPGTVNFPVSTVRNISTLGPGTISPANVGRYAFAHAIGGNVVADATTGLPLPDGRTVPVTVRSTIPKASASAAIGRFLRKGLPLVGTGVALYDLAKELGYDLESNGGSVVITKPDTSLCTSAPCYEYQYSQLQPWVRSPATACVAGFAAVQGSSTTTVYSYTHFIEPNQCEGTRSINGATPTRSAINVTRRTATVQPPASIPATPEEFEQALNDKPSFPYGSAFTRAWVDAVDAGELYTPQPDSVTGPASTPGPQSTTTDAVNGTTTTSTTTHQHTYNGPNVTTTTTTTNVTVDNSTGATVSNTTTTASPVMPDRPAQEEDSGTPTDTALPGQPELYTPEYPEGLTGVWNSKQSQLQALPILDLLGDLMPNVAASGTCPSWTLDMDLYIVDYGAHVIAIPCWIWDFGKVVIICSALLLSRRLIFGG